MGFGAAKRTQQEQVDLGDGHDAHDGGDAAAKGQQARQRVPGDAAQRARGAAADLRRGAPRQAGDVQPVQVLQEAPLRAVYVKPVAGQLFELSRTHALLLPARDRACPLAQTQHT